ncbi:uncharacterized protein LOC124354286 [Homalodisca vitripennis]|uniref:uncharacterized protein LOC124354286 n=1 Tax=Homalodisca vitripennis TaxID=197043 RepID=UPI001EEA665A|nr:uncharacterized protein LOC124354286 [Homalodisca vitripennis]
MSRTALFSVDKRMEVLGRKHFYRPAPGRLGTEHRLRQAEYDARAGRDGVHVRRNGVHGWNGQETVMFSGDRHVQNVPNQSAKSKDQLVFLGAYRSQFIIPGNAF